MIGQINKMTSKSRVNPLSKTVRWVLLLIDRIQDSANTRNDTAPYVRGRLCVPILLNNLFIASIPCWLIGLWNVGYQSNLVLFESELARIPGWRGFILQGLGLGPDPENILACFMLGLLYFLPLFVAALLVTAFWDVIFSVLRNRQLDAGLLASAWLYTLFLPAGAPVGITMLGLSFGMIFGKHVYGGAGRHLVNPVVLGLLFLWLAYPDVVFSGDNWVPVSDRPHLSALRLASAGGVDAMTAAGLGWWDLFLGREPGALGTTSALGCLLAATYLLISGTVSWRVIAGALLGTLAIGSLFNYLADGTAPMLSVTWGWHAVLGGLAFGTVFFATDPAVGALTNPGRWAYGVLVGMLVILIRVASPAGESAILPALVLSSLIAPIIDFVVIEVHVRKRRRRLQEVTNG